jgi:pentatricopeptide repeat protein
MGDTVRRPESAAGEDAAEVELGFVELYEHYVTPMIRLAWALTGTQEIAEDVVHDCFIRVYAKWRRVDNAPAYLRQAVVNGCRSASRRRSTERTHEGLFVVGSGRLEADEMFDALAQLPYRQRAALVLQFYEGIPQSEIASLLGCREGTVASLVHRGLAQLRRVIEP